LPHAVKRNQVTMQLRVCQHPSTVKNQSLHMVKLTPGFRTRGERLKPSTANR
jgi:hypothetical protein